MPDEYNAAAKVPNFAKFIIGGASGIVAQLVTHPMDVIKIRMQISRVSLGQITRYTFATEGFHGFYTGLSASLFRQITYTAAKLGTYNMLIDSSEENFGHLSYGVTLSLGMIAGVIGAFIGTPSDVVMIRMIGDIRLPKERRRNYKNAIAGLDKIFKFEGATCMWRGAVPTMARGAIVSAVQLGTYSQSKFLLKGVADDGLLLQIEASIISGLVIAITSLPVDVAKTRIQNWNYPSKPPSAATVISDIVKVEGFLTMWRGFLPYYARICPNTIITLVCMEQLSQLYMRTWHS